MGDATTSSSTRGSGVDVVAHTACGPVRNGGMRASLSSPSLQEQEQLQQQQEEHQDAAAQLVPAHSSRSVGNLSCLAHMPMHAGAPGATSRFGRQAGSSGSGAALLPDEASFAKQADAAPPWEEQQQQAGTRDCAGASSSGGGAASAHRWTFGNSQYGGSEAWGREWRVHCVTFNMGGKLPDSLPDALLGQVSTGDGAGQLPDVLAFATQENTSIGEWERQLAGALGGPRGYARLAGASLRAIHLVLFASARFRRQVLSIRSSSVATGIGNVVGNKGGVALSVELLDMWLLFISSHFAAHGDQVGARNADFARIKAGLFASSSTTAGASPGSASSRSFSPRATAATAFGGRSSASLGGLAPSPGTSGSGVLPKQRCMSCVGLRSLLPAQAPEAGSPSGSTNGSASWRGLLRSNRVAPAATEGDSGGGSSGGVSGSGGSSGDGGNAGGRGSSSPAGTQRRVGWCSELSQAAASGADSGPPTRSALSVPDLAAGQAEAAAAAAAAAESHDELLRSQLSQLRVASCPVGARPPLDATPADSGDSSSSSSGAQADCPRGLPGSGATTPLTATAAGDGGSSGFFKALAVKRLARVSRGSASSARCARGPDVLEAHDAVFWLGDLNYRINGNGKAVRYLMRSMLLEVLHANDQLRLQQRQGLAFQGFEEGAIRFPPTFKFHPGSSVYSEQRVPSWTDRVLWRVRSTPPSEQQASAPGTPSGSSTFLAGDLPPPEVAQLYYTSVPQVVSSDHKPVIAGFVLAVPGGEEAEADGLSCSEDGGNPPPRVPCCCVM